MFSPARWLSSVPSRSCSFMLKRALSMDFKRNSSLLDYSVKQNEHKPAVGRQVDVVNGNVNGALIRLNNILRVDKIREKYRYNLFYEKPCQKRRREKRLRKEGEFAKRVREKMMAVREMVKRGL